MLQESGEQGRQADWFSAAISSLSTTPNLGTLKKRSSGSSDAAMALINFSVDEIVNPKLKAATRSQIKKWKLEEKAGKAKSDAAFLAGNVVHVAAKESVAS